MLVFKKLDKRISDTDMDILLKASLDKDRVWKEAHASEIEKINDGCINQSDPFILYYNHDPIFDSIANKLTEEHNISHKTILAKTFKNNMHPPHADRSRNYSLYIPIYPNMHDYAPMTFYHDNELHYINNFDPGAVYLVNHKVMHSVFNFTDYDRYNLQITLRTEEDALPFI
tara:strand:+ start:62 stop:577 length:516 start_codon:yes stop_codon:yes gene_type:complete